MTTVVSAVYDTRNNAEAAIRELKNAGTAESDISLVSNDENKDYAHKVANDAGGGATVGTVIGGAGGLLAGLGLLAIPGLGPVVAAGWLTSTAVAAAAGAAIGGVTGGLVGALTESGVPEEEANFYAETVRRGGTLVTVRTKDGSDATKTRDILQRHQSINRDERTQAYRASGWTRFDPDAEPYDARKTTTHKAA